MVLSERGVDVVLVLVLGVAGVRLFLALPDKSICKSRAKYINGEDVKCVNDVNVNVIKDEDIVMLPSTIFVT